MDSNKPDHKERKELVTSIMDSHGQSLVNNLITASVFILPSYMLLEVAETFKIVSSNFKY